MSTSPPNLPKSRGRPRRECMKEAVSDLKLVAVSGALNRGHFLSSEGS